MPRDNAKTSREIGNNSHGFDNEDALVDSLNQKAYAELTNALKNFVDYAAYEKNIKLRDDLILYATKEPDNRYKQDLYLYIDGKKYGISLKIGSGNSIHQEKCEDFIKYIKDEFGASDKICDDFRLYLWCDGTLDGSGSKEKNLDGKITCRFGSGEFYKKYPEEFDEMQKFLDDNAEALAKHFIAEGRHNSNVEFIYHGDSDYASFASIDEIIKMNLNKRKKNHLSIGNMTLQSWNASLGGTCEKKRGQLQVKYGQLKKDIDSALKYYNQNAGLFEGNKEEYSLSSEFNKNKNGKKWKILLGDLKIDEVSNIFMVKVSDRVVSKLSGKKVLPKSDSYLIRCEQIDQSFLLRREYHIEEKDLAGYKYTKINNSGISVKLEGSTRYTIQKFTVDSFLKAFSLLLDNPRYLFWGLLIYSNENEKYKNNAITDDLHLNRNDLQSYFESSLRHRLDLDNINDLNDIRKYSQQITKEAITNSNLHKSIFTGFGWFKEPYVAHYLYKDKTLFRNIPSDFTITTGSGRSKHNYTIEIKPIS